MGMVRRLWERVVYGGERQEPGTSNHGDGLPPFGVVAVIPEGYAAEDATIMLHCPQVQTDALCIDTRCRRENPEPSVKLYGVGLSGSLYSCDHCGARW